ncbi:unnamed protein product [Amoebophrya sp. A25]|nr:unnamed protein product [Amoebophrya sp. A25]|eukprot:GSA25T00000729001.1
MLSLVLAFALLWGLSEPHRDLSARGQRSYIPVDTPGSLAHAFKLLGDSANLADDKNEDHDPEADSADDSFRLSKRISKEEADSIGEYEEQAMSYYQSLGGAQEASRVMISASTSVSAAAASPKMADDTLDGAERPLESSKVVVADMEDADLLLTAFGMRHLLVQYRRLPPPDRELAALLEQKWIPALKIRDDDVSSLLRRSLVRRKPS